jgi:hypothetical protein
MIKRICSLRRHNNTKCVLLLTSNVKIDEAKPDRVERRHKHIYKIGDFNIPQ